MYPDRASLYILARRWRAGDQKALPLVSIGSKQLKEMRVTTILSTSNSDYMWCWQYGDY